MDRPADSERNISSTRSLFDGMREHLQDAVYVNNLGVEGADLVRAAFGGNHRRLVKVKRAYDPANVLHLDQSISPEGAP